LQACSYQYQALPKRGNAQMLTILLNSTADKLTTKKLYHHNRLLYPQAEILGTIFKKIGYNHYDEISRVK
jgi:hypothetical protein